MSQSTRQPDPWKPAAKREEKFAPQGTFIRALVLFVANEVGVFERLSGGPLDAEQIARRMKANRKGARVLLDALVALKYLKKSGDLYENEPDTARYLTEDSPEYVGTMLSHSYHSMRRWLRLEDMVRKGQKHRHTLPEFQATDAAERKRVRKFTVGLDQSSQGTAALVADILDLDGVETLLDLGGGGGTYSIAFARKWKSLRPTIFEASAPARIARAQAKEAGLSKRIGVIAGDFLEDDLGSERYDAVFVSNIIHIYSAAKNKQIIRKVHRALRRGGMIVIKDMLVDDGRDGPYYPLMFALTMLMFTDEGDTYTFSEVSDWLREAGFARVRRRTVIPRETFLLVGKKK